jgi:hypothetical protein
MLPVGAPTNALVYSSGHLELKDMASFLLFIVEEFNRENFLIFFSFIF